MWLLVQVSVATMNWFCCVIAQSHMESLCGCVCAPLGVVLCLLLCTRTCTQERVFNGRNYIMERAIVGDFALIKGWKADKSGNIVFRRSARNLNVPMAKAGKVSIAEVEEIVETGDIPPEDVHLPGIYVQRVVLGKSYKKPIEVCVCVCVCVCV